MADLSPTVADTPWLTPELLEFRGQVMAFSRAELAATPADAIARDHDGTFWREGWDACGRFGIQGLPVPAELGGHGATALATAVALEALGYACEDGGLVFSVNAHLWSAVTPVWKHGTPAQQERWLPGLCDGSTIGIHAVTEPDAGSDAFGMTTRADADGDGWRLTGRKTFITNAPVADLFILFARTTAGTGPTGITAFLVERGAPGLDVPGHLEKMGLRTSPMAEIVLDGVPVGPDQVLGDVGRGARVFQTSMDWERGLIMAAQVGAMQRATETTIGYSVQREQFDEPIASLGGVSDRIAGMAVRLHAARAMLYRAAHVMDAGDDPTATSAQAKVFISEAAIATHMDAMQVHGGYGYMTELQIERALRDALGGTIYSGTTEIQLRIIAKRLGL